MPKTSGTDKAKSLLKAKAKLKKFKKDQMNKDDDNFDTQSNFSTMSTTSISQRVASLTKNKNKSATISVSPNNTPRPETQVQNGNHHPNGQISPINSNISNNSLNTSYNSQNNSIPIQNNDIIPDNTSNNTSNNTPPVQAVSTPPQPPTQPPPISSSSTSVTPSGSSTPNVEQIAQHYQKQFQQHQQHAQQQAQLQMQSIHHLVTEKEQLLQKIGQLETHIRQTSTKTQSSNSSSLNFKQKLENLQREFQLTREVKEKHQKAAEQLEYELEQLNNSYKQVLSRNEELYERNSEISHQLSTKSAQLIEANKEVSELLDTKNGLEGKIKNIDLLQESNRNLDSQSLAASEAVESLNEEKAKLHAQLVEINASVDLYKKTVQDLTGERVSLLSQIEQVNNHWQDRLDKSHLELEEMRTLNRDLKIKEIDQTDVAHMKAGLVSKEHDLETQVGISHKLKADFEQLSSEKMKLDRKLESQLSDNETLVKLNMEQSDKISEYEGHLRVLQEQVRDRQEILSSAEGERSTLQRAILQNKDLKNQLTELQQALIQTNNAKAEAMTESDLLKSKLAKAKSGIAAGESSNSSNEASINQIMQALSSEKQMSAELQVQVESMGSRMRLLEQNNQVLQHQLTVEREERIEERSNSQMSVSEQNSGHGTPRSGMGSPGGYTDDKLIQALAQEKLKTASLHDQMLQMQDSLNRNSLAARDETTEVDRQQDLIEKLELRLQREVQVHANMGEKLDEFEIANAQLQAENETINEYVALYREQRSALKQMQYADSQHRQEVDEEKEAMCLKLEELELLVKTLLADKSMRNQSQPGVLDQEAATAEKIFEIIDDVVESHGVECEPLQLNIPYYGPQWDI